MILTLNMDRELSMIEPFVKKHKYTFTVIPAQSYLQGMSVNGIPRNWVVSMDGKLKFEGVGFDGNGDEWMKQARAMIQKVKATN
jgi:hypothetical protein